MAEAVRFVGVDGDVTDDVVTNVEEDRTGVGVIREAVIEVDDCCMEVAEAVDEAAGTSDDMGVDVVVVLEDISVDVAGGVDVAVLDGEACVRLGDDEDDVSSEDVATEAGEDEADAELDEEAVSEVDGDWTRTTAAVDETVEVLVGLEDEASDGVDDG
jgi:hypothetical protein